MSRDPRIDAYIDSALPFARPILRHIRELVHEADPGVEETLKWGMPTFVREGIICSMAAFKAHVALSFWKAELVLGRSTKGRESMGHFGRIAGLGDLPPDRKLIEYVRKAVALNEAGVRAPRTRRVKPDLPLPDDFRAALAQQKVLGAFEAAAPSYRREYIEWVSEAKTAATRARRIATAVEWVGAGKGRNWKYEK